MTRPEVNPKSLNLQIHFFLLSKV